MHVGAGLPRDSSSAATIAIAGQARSHEIYESNEIYESHEPYESCILLRSASTAALRTLAITHKDQHVRLE
ncbi:hypothetical protein [Pseudomonas sp.]|jgi:hypothetical protein|uniref:hypothetical protein n=1 Tax=Pseudomonas sp. TaxID=306 RepID=UPI0028968CAF|nr:hypothetical protein [Pseudomonas sp.]